MYDLAQEFKRLGHEVSVITADPYLTNSFSISVEDGIKVLRVRTGQIDGASKIRRAINEITLSAVIWRKGKKFFAENGCDLVVWYSPSIFFGRLIQKVKRAFGASSYLILRDIFPQWALDIGILKKGLVYSFFKQKEFEQYRAADVIGVQSPANLQYFTGNGLDQRFHLEVLYNWTKTEEGIVENGNFRKDLQLEDKVVFFYGGNIGVAQDMDNIVRLAKNMQDYGQAYFLIVGEGSESQRLKDLIKKENLKNISIHGAVNQSTYLSMLSEFDVGLISLDGKFQTPNFPGKMLGYLYFSMPTLASINQGNDLGDVLQQRKAGLVSFNGDDELLQKNALMLLQDADLRKSLGLNAKQLLADTFSVETAANKILSKFI